MQKVIAERSLWAAHRIESLINEDPEDTRIQAIIDQMGEMMAVLTFDLVSHDTRRVENQGCASAE